MENLVVIRPVTKHTDWVSTINYVKKSDRSLRVSELDAKSGYWSVQLVPESQILTTFNSPLGQYCSNRFPFGLKVSQDVFQRVIDHILFNLTGVVFIADDITVDGKD